MRKKITTSTITNGIVSNDKLVAYDQVHRFDEEGNYLANGRHGMSVAAGYKAVEITAEQHAKLLEYTHTQKQDEEQYFTCPVACDYVKFVLLTGEMYGYDVVGYKVTTEPTTENSKPETENRGWLSAKILHRASFGNQAQKKLFQRLDNLANVFESIYSRHQNQLLRHFVTEQRTTNHKQQTGKWHYRQPTFLTLTIPSNTKQVHTVNVSEAKEEAKERSEKNLQEFYGWVRWKFLKQLPPDMQIVQAYFNSDSELFVRIGLSDKFIKKNLLDHLLQNFAKTYGLKAYVWKAEAQLRGEIHFHIVLDCYIERADIKRLWWGYVAKYKLYNEGFKQGDLFKIHTVENMNLWIESRPNPGSLKAEMAGYFAHQLDKHGNVRYKHNKRKTVRAIEGSAWGCSDNLKYDPLTLTDLSDRDIEMIEENCVRYIPISARDKDKKVKLGYDGKPLVMARVFVNRHSEKTVDKVPGVSAAEYTTTEKYYQPIREKLWDYHLTKATEIYATAN